MVSTLNEAQFSHVSGGIKGLVYFKWSPPNFPPTCLVGLADLCSGICMAPKWIPTMTLWAAPFDTERHGERANRVVYGSQYTPPSRVTGYRAPNHITINVLISFNPNCLCHLRQVLLSPSMIIYSKAAYIVTVAKKNTHTQYHFQYFQPLRSNVTSKVELWIIVSMNYANWHPPPPPPFC